MSVDPTGMVEKEPPPPPGSKQPRSISESMDAGGSNPRFGAQTGIEFNVIFGGKITNPAFGANPFDSTQADRTANVSFQSFEYSQSSGELSQHTTNWQLHENAPPVITGESSVHVGKGYSGGNDGHNPEGRDNPKFALTPSVGPIPKGFWSIGSSQHGPHGKHQSWASPHMHLTPLNGVMLGKRGPKDFWIHGDNDRRNHSGSEGCVVLDRPYRTTIDRSGISLLHVVE